MRLVQKLTVAYFAAACLVVGTTGVIRVHREAALFSVQASREHRSVARALRSSVLAVWRTEGRERALAVLRDANKTHGRISFRWVTADAHPGITAIDPTAIEPAPYTVEGRDAAGGEARLTYIRVTAADGSRGAIELTESLVDQRTNARRTLLEALASTVALLAIFAAVAVGVGVWLVGRPVRALSDKARRMGEGDFADPVVVGGSDELARLAEEMNGACERLVAARTQVEAAAAARIAALEQLRHADRLSTVGKLASGVAHELGTPLNIIAWRAEMIASREVEGDAVVDCARSIGEAAQRVAAIVRQLLDFARRKGPERSEFDLCRTAREVTELLRTLAEKKRANLRIATAGPLVVSADPVQIQQAVTNLVVNAIHAVDDGGNVEVTCEASGGEAMLSVRDDGEGIDGEHLMSVFDPFFTTKAVGEGTGLGLSIASGIVRDHGGSLGVDSKAGAGATFTLRLPLAELR